VAPTPEVATTPAPEVAKRAPAPTASRPHHRADKASSKPASPKTAAAPAAPNPALARPAAPATSDKPKVNLGI